MSRHKTKMVEVKHLDVGNLDFQGIVSSSMPVVPAPSLAFTYLQYTALSLGLTLQVCST